MKKGTKTEKVKIREGLWKLWRYSYRVLPNLHEIKHKELKRVVAKTRQTIVDYMIALGFRNWREDLERIDPWFKENKKLLKV